MFETPDLVSSRCLLVQHGADMVGRWGLGLCPLWAGCGWVTEPQEPRFTVPGWPELLGLQAPFPDETEASRPHSSGPWRHVELESASALQPCGGTRLGAAVSSALVSAPA